jgi:DNA-directed RNA polymerase specialized sigma24 family protein
MQIKQGLVVHSTVSFDDLPPGFDLPDASSLKGFERVDGRNELAAPLKTLRPRDVEILRLHYLEGLPFVEIAARLKVSEPRVSQLHTRALQRLHAVMIGPRAALTRVTPSPPAPAAPPPQRKPRGPRGLGMRTRAQLERARRLRVEGFSLREIVEVTGLSKETVMRHTPVVPRAEAMRRKHVRWKARGTPVLPPWRRARPE